MEPRHAGEPSSILSRQQPEDRARHPVQNEAMQLKRNTKKIEPMTSTPRQLGFMRGHGVATAELKRDFADDINVMFRQ